MKDPFNIALAPFVNDTKIFRKDYAYLRFFDEFGNVLFDLNSLTGNYSNTYNPRTFPFDRCKYEKLIGRDDVASVKFYIDSCRLDNVKCVRKGATIMELSLV